MGELNIKSTTIEKGLDLAKGFLQKLIGPSVDELGLMWSDNVKLWRLKLQIKNLEKVQGIVEDRKIDIKHVNLKVLVPYLEGVSLEEDETLQDLWANLFVNYIDVSKNLRITVYPGILAQLSSDDVVILQHMINNRGRATIGSDYEPNELSEEAAANLKRLGLIEEEPEFNSYGGTAFRESSIELVYSDKYYISDFGWNFLKALNLNTEPDKPQ